MNLKFLLSLVFCMGIVYNLHSQILPAQFGVPNPSRPGANPIVTSGLVLHLDAGNKNSYNTTRIITGAKIYSVYAAGLRSANYTVQYSDDNSNWTTAFTGVMSNNSSCGFQTGSGVGLNSVGAHRYWRYVEGSVVVSHHPRTSRIILIDSGGAEHTIARYTDDNCSDLGDYIIGTVSYDFTSEWTDLSGSGNNGTLTNGPTYTSSNGGTIVFDGTDDVASFGNILNMGLSSWTMSCWVKFNVGSGFGGIMGKTSYRGYVGRYSFYMENNNLHAFFQPNANYIITTEIAPYFNNKFHNLVMTIDRTSMMYFYIDGVSVGTPLNVSSTSNINLNSSTDNFYIGSYGSSNGLSPYAFLNGNVSQAAIYNRALPAAEVLQNYNALSSRFSGNGDVTNPSTGKTWMDRNLGATQVASSSTDANSYGDLYQWGRAADGHQSRTSGTTTTFSSTDQTGNANFILGPNPPYDWRTTTNSNLWQGMNGVNNPCPTGYRLPTQAEWDAERLSWSSQNAAGAFASPLKLPMAGRRDGSDGSITQLGTHGWYWSSTTAYQGACNCNISKRLYFFNTGFNNTDDNGRSNGFTVRCIKD
jgi:hypothetical protein